MWPPLRGDVMGEPQRSESGPLQKEGNPTGNADAFPQIILWLLLLHPVAAAAAASFSESVEVKEERWHCLMEVCKGLKQADQTSRVCDTIEQAQSSQCWGGRGVS